MRNILLEKKFSHMKNTNFSQKNKTSFFRIFNKLNVISDFSFIYLKYQKKKKSDSSHMKKKRFLIKGYETFSIMSLNFHLCNFFKKQCNS